MIPCDFDTTCLHCTFTFPLELGAKTWVQFSQNCICKYMASIQCNLNPSYLFLPRFTNLYFFARWQDTPKWELIWITCEYWWDDQTKLCPGCILSGQRSLHFQLRQTHRFCPDIQVMRICWRQIICETENQIISHGTFYTYFAQVLLPPHLKV